MFFSPRGCGQSFKLKLLEMNILHKVTLSACILFCAIVARGEDVTFNDITYSLDAATMTATVIDCDINKTGNVAIPQTVSGGYTVTTIGNNAFSRCDNLTAIYIPNTVTEIDDEAFRFCYGLTTMNIPNSVTSIGNNAFGYCSSLESVGLSASLTKIGDRLFAYCDKLYSIILPNSITEIGDSAFFGCDARDGRGGYARYYACDYAGNCSGQKEDSVWWYGISSSWYRGTPC